MGAGTPNYQRLKELGKLPSSARDKIVELKEIDELKEQIVKMSKAMCKKCKEKILGEKVEDNKIKENEK